MKKRFLLAAFTVFLIFGNATTDAAAADFVVSSNGKNVLEQSEEGVGVLGEGPGSENDDISDPTDNKIQLPVVQNMRWDEYGDIFFEGVEESHGYYNVEIYRDEEIILQTSWSIGGNEENEVLLPTSVYFEESGAYKFRIQTLASYDDEKYLASEWSELSEEYEYIVPEEALTMTTVAKWDEKELGKYTYESVANAGGYEIKLGKEGEDFGSSGWSVFHDRKDVEGRIFSGSFSYAIQTGGKYYIQIRALSPDIREIAHGEWGPKSEILDTNEVADFVKNWIEEVSENTTSAEAAVNQLMRKNQAFLEKAMQTDEDTLNAMKELEEKYMEEKGVDVSVKVAEEVKNKVDVSKVSIVGAAVNGAGKNVDLDISVPTKQEVIDQKNYVKSVQLDIRLTTDEEIHKLSIPATITMPIPEGIRADKLEIFHYKQNGSIPERVNFRVNADNTITFTVREFSTFAFAQIKMNVVEAFEDIQETDWWKNSIQFAVDNKIMTGMGKVFRPTQDITREQFVQVLYNVSKTPSVEGVENPYTDVKDSWYKNAVLWAKQQNIANGIPGGSFGVGESITREALALMLYKYAIMIDYKTDVEEGKASQYADGEKVSTWAKTAIDWAVTQGVMNGKGSGDDLSSYRLDPQGSATRAECAAMMKNFFEDIMTQ